MTRRVDVERGRERERREDEENCIPLFVLKHLGIIDRCLKYFGKLLGIAIRGAWASPICIPMMFVIFYITTSSF